MKMTMRYLLMEDKPNPRGLFPIYLRITINRKLSRISTGEYISLRQWDDRNERVKNHPLEVDINARLAELKSRLSRKFTEQAIAGKSISAAELKSHVAGGESMHNLFVFVEAFIKEVKHKRSASTLENYRKHLQKLENFHGSQSLHFEDITPEFLMRYETYLRTEGRELDSKEKKEGVGNNYVHALFKTLKVLFNAAIRRGLITDYPFDRYENPIYTPPVKDYLTLEEIQRVEQLADETTDPILKQTAIYFLLGISTGLRISDWLQFSISDHIRNDEVLLRAEKNGEWVSMPVNPILKRNIPRMLAFPLTIEEQTINRSLKSVARKTKIKKHVTTHTGRHTFAITLCADRGVSSETCAELMGITIKTCVENYYRVTTRKIHKETLAAWEGLE